MSAQSFQVVRCEVRWHVSIGFSGNELGPQSWESVGPFESKELAEQCLADRGFVNQSPFWRDRTGYGYASIARILKEIG